MDQIRPDQIKWTLARNISQAKAELSALVERVIKGEEVILNGGEACRESGEIWIAPDFDQLSDDMAEAFGLRRQNADQSTLILASVLIRIRVAHIELPI